MRTSSAAVEAAWAAISVSLREARKTASVGQVTVAEEDVISAAVGNATGLLIGDELPELPLAEGSPPELNGRGESTVPPNPPNTGVGGGLP
jgi:hypothetical protein